MGVEGSGAERDGETKEDVWYANLYDSITFCLRNSIDTLLSCWEGNGHSIIVTVIKQHFYILPFTMLFALPTVF